MSSKELREFKEQLFEIKHPKLNKVLESDKVDKIITKVQDLYHNISSKLILKYNLEDELKQGKIFTILIAILFFILLIVLTLFFALTLNSIIGIGLIFAFTREVVFCIKWGYTIIKNKGKIIKKYLSNLFPNSKILEEVKERKKIPLYEEYILYQIEDFINLLNKSKVDNEKEIILALKNIVNDLKINSNKFKEEVYSLDYKKDISNRLASIYKLYYDNLTKLQQEQDFYELKNDVLEQLNDITSKKYVKKL